MARESQTRSALRAAPVPVYEPRAYLHAARALVSKQGGEVEQRFAGVEKRLADDAHQIEGIGSRLQTVETSLTETGQLARTAQAQAEEAAGRLTRLWGNRNKRDLVETLEVRFGFDRWDLDDAAQTSLASLAKELRSEERRVGKECRTRGAAEV